MSIIESNRKIYNSYSEDWIKNADSFDENSGGFYVIHREHNFDKKNGRYEIESAKALITEGYRIELQSERSRIQGVKIPDGLLNGKLCELKAVIKNSAKSIQRQIEDSARKKALFVVLHFTEEYHNEIFLNALNKWKGIAEKSMLSIEIIKTNKEGIIK